MNKREELIANLQSGWMPVATPMTVLNWKHTTVRGAISDIGRKRGLKVERQRVDGVTSYRIAPETLKEIA
jgi:hypothetical protein